MSVTDQAISLLNGDPDVVPGARSLLAEELIKGSYEDGAAPMPQRLAAMKADPKHAFMFNATTQGGSGVGFVNGQVPSTEPAPGSVEAIAARYVAQNTGFGLQPAGLVPKDISRRSAPPPAPAPGPSFHQEQQQQQAAHLAAHLRGVQAMQNATGPGMSAGFGLAPKK